MTITRAHVAATVPERGRLTASANIVFNWLPDTDVNDVEEAIKKAAKAAIVEARKRVPAAAGEAVEGQLPLFPLEP